MYAKMDYTASDSRMLEIISAVERAVGDMVSANTGIQLDTARDIAFLFTQWERLSVDDRIRDADATRDQASKTLEIAQRAEQEAHAYAAELRKKEDALEQKEEVLKVKDQEAEAYLESRTAALDEREKQL